MLEQQRCLAQLGLERAAFKKKKRKKTERRTKVKRTNKRKRGVRLAHPQLSALRSKNNLHTHTLRHRRNNPWATWTYLICLSFSRGINFFFLICSVSLNQISSVRFSPHGPSPVWLSDSPSLPTATSVA